MIPLHEYIDELLMDNFLDEFYAKLKTSEGKIKTPDATDETYFSRYLDLMNIKEVTPSDKTSVDSLFEIRKIRKVYDEAKALRIPNKKIAEIILRSDTANVAKNIEKLVEINRKRKSRSS